jgi:tetratricopeptide (TPR) repeat protein
VLHRAKTSGRMLLISAQGGASDEGSPNGWDGFEVVAIPEIHLNEVEALCIQEGCPETHASFWGATVCTLSAGHPKLVQVRVAELSEHGWPKPDATYIAATSTASESVRLMARSLVGESWPPEVVEFLFCLSECMLSLRRAVAIKLAELLGGIRNPGDVLDRLTGKWVDCVEGEWFRATPLLGGAARTAWSPERFAVAHVRIHDAISAQSRLSPSEASALVYHAFIAREPRRLATACMKLRTIKDDGAREAVERNLLWMPFVALEPGQRPADDAIAGTAFRMFQFSVAVTVDSDVLPKIARRWIEETAMVSHPDMSLAMQAMMLVTFAIADTKKLPLKIRLDAISELSRLTMKGDIGSEIAEGLASSLAKSVEAEEGFPPNATQIQVLLALCSRWIRDAETLEELIQWLDTDAPEDIRSDFDRILEWPLVQTMGAFVQSAWASKWEQTTDWSAWLALFDYVYAYAKRRTAPNLAAEAIKGKAIVLAEYLSRAEEALEIIDDAEQEFGRNAVLDEQRINVLFQRGSDSKVVELWEQFVTDNQPVFDPFAYRRAAISAARLRMLGKAEEYFRKAAEVAKEMPDTWTRVGLLADCALVISMEGSQRRAAATLAEAFKSLPKPSVEGDARGEAVQRFMAEICRRIENALYKPSDTGLKVEPGQVSSPSLKVSQLAQGQSLRTVLTMAQVDKVAACFGIPGISADIQDFESPDAFSGEMVRWVFAEARLSEAFYRGADANFIRCFVQFVAATAALGRLRSGECGDGRPSTVGEFSGSEQWFGLVVAGVCCSGAALDENLRLWMTMLKEFSSEQNEIERLIAQIEGGAQIGTTAELRSVVVDSNATTATRCGAAAKLMLKGVGPAELLQIQAWLTSVMMADASSARQELFDFHVTARFSALWERVTASPFQLHTPRVTVPSIKASIAAAAEGRVTLRTFLLGLSRTLNIPLGKFVEHVR